MRRAGEVVKYVAGRRPDGRRLEGDAVTVVLVLVGGAVGAPLRYLTDLFVQARHDSVLPWGTLTVNVLGLAGPGRLAGAVAHAVRRPGCSPWSAPASAARSRRSPPSGSRPSGCSRTARGSRR